MAIGITNKILWENKCHAAVCWILTNAGEKPEYHFQASFKYYIAFPCCSAS